MAAHINVGYDYYVNKDGKITKFLKSSKAIGNLFSYYNIILLNIMSIFFVIQSMAKARFLIYDLKFFYDISIYKHDELFRKHFSIYFWSVTILSTTIYATLLYRITQDFI